MHLLLLRPVRLLALRQPSALLSGQPLVLRRLVRLFLFLLLLFSHDFLSFLIFKFRLPKYEEPENITDSIMTG